MSATSSICCCVSLSAAGQRWARAQGVYGIVRRLVNDGSLLSHRVRHSVTMFGLLGESRFGWHGASPSDRREFVKLHGARVH